MRLERQSLFFRVNNATIQVEKMKRKSGIQRFMGIELESTTLKLTKTTNRTRTTFVKKEAYFPFSNGKSFNFTLESNRIIAKNRSTAIESGSF